VLVVEDAVRERQFYLAGQWRGSSDRATIRSPYDDRPIAEVCLAGPADIEEATVAAVRSYEETRRLTAADRGTILHRLHSGIVARRSEFEETMVAEAGKPIQQVRLEIERGLCTIALAEEEARRVAGDVIPIDMLAANAGKLAITRRVPIGPVLGIPAFNFPFNLVAHKIAPALAAGNPVLLKPAPQTPLTALLLAEIFEATGAPPGMLSVLPCRNEVAEIMVADDRIKALTFTGSTKVGWYLKTKAGKKKLLLELGGNAGAIVDKDADLDNAARRCAVAAFAYAGQVCVSLQRLYVHRAVYPAFVERLLAVVGRLKLGDPMDEATVVGPMIDDRAAARGEQLIAETVAAGGRVLIGGTRQGRLLAPTVLADLTPGMRVSREEAFAPLVTISPFDDLDEAIRLVNDTPYGLAAGIFTGSIHSMMKAFDGIETGSLIVNDGPLFRADNAPFGGFKDSGIGREAVRETLEQFTETKLLVVSY